MSVKFRGMKDAITLNNNSASALVAADINKTATLKDATSKEVAICADGAVIDGIVSSVDKTGDVVVIETTGMFKCTAAAAVACPGYAVADGAGGVKTSGSATNARVFAYISATECWIRLN